ncbi:hypothetical protein Q1695_006082 [Nippostrongylus brasiliensis]|nr:hypothetical protein Q1695_006082 [Nippostrongylus brasiliensis]
MDEEEPRLMAPEPLEEQQSLPGEAASSESVSDEGVSQGSVHLEELSARQEQTASDAGCEQPRVSLPVKRHHADEKV